MEDREVRKYEKIWRQLKERDRSTVKIAHPSLAKRVRAGVIKEKNRDMAFKILNDNGETFRLKIDYDAATRKMEFRLVQPLGISEKVVV